MVYWYPTEACYSRWERRSRRVQIKSGVEREREEELDGIADGGDLAQRDTAEARMMHSMALQEEEIWYGATTEWALRPEQSIGVLLPAQIVKNHDNDAMESSYIVVGSRQALWLDRRRRTTELSIEREREFLLIFMKVNIVILLRFMQVSTRNKFSLEWSLNL